MADALLWIVLIPVLAAILTLCLPGRQAGAARGIALAGTLLPLAFAVAVYAVFASGTAEPQFGFSLAWLTVPNAYQLSPLTIRFALAVDGVSLPLVLLTGVVSVLAVIRSFRVTERIRAHYFWMLTLTAGLYGVFAAADMFAFFFFLESTLVASYFLIGIWGGEKRRYAATKFIVYRGVASVLVLAGLVGVAFAYADQAQTGSLKVFLPYAPDFLTLSIPNLLHEAAYFTPSVPVQNVLYLVFLLAVLIEEAFFPFHTWLPDTHEHSDTGTNMMIGGVLMKIGLYILIRFAVALLPQGLADNAALTAVLGVISILYGAFVALAQKDWRRLVAFSSISHMGLVLLAIASMQVIGIQGALFMLVSSGLLTALLFYALGAQADRTGSFLIGDLGGLSKSLPVLSGVLLFAVLGSVGLPGLSGFISEFTSFTGGFATFPALSAIGAVGMILAALYFLYAMQRTTFGPTKREHEGLTDARAIEYVPLTVLTALVVLIGVYPNVLGHVVHSTVSALLTRVGG